MPEHVLHPGLQVIEALAELGECLGYEVARTPADDSQPRRWVC